MGDIDFNFDDFMADLSRLLFEVENRTSFTEDDRYLLAEKCQESLRTLFHLGYIHANNIPQIDELIQNFQIFYQDIRRELMSSRQRGRPSLAIVRTAEPSTCTRFFINKKLFEGAQ